jgi:hypothetical protein
MLPPNAVAILFIGLLALTAAAPALIPRETWENNENAMQIIGPVIGALTVFSALIFWAVYSFHDFSLV